MFYYWPYHFCKLIWLVPHMPVSQDLVTIIQKYILQVYLIYPQYCILPPSDNLYCINMAYVQVCQLYHGCNIFLVTFCVKNIASLCVKKLLHFALKLLHFASKVITFQENVTFCVKNCYILWCNRGHFWKYFVRLDMLGIKRWWKNADSQSMDYAYGLP